jgi:hypothetical protein
MTLTTTELMAIYTRVSERVDRGTSAYGLILGLLGRRAELEGRIAQQLDEIVPREYDRTDRLMVAFIEELQNEVAQHRTFAADLKSRVVAPANVFFAQMKERQHNIQNAVRRDMVPLQKAVTEARAAMAAVEVEQAKLPSTPQPKLNAQSKRIQKMLQACRKKEQSEMQLAHKLEATAIPLLREEFKDYDASRVVKMQASIVAFQKLKGKLNERIGEGMKVFDGVMITYDGWDRSNRYVERAFDPRTRSLSEEDPPEVQVVAIAEFCSSSEKDLHFERGDRIRVLVQHYSGWWEGELDGRRGMFPKSFVVFDDENKCDEQPVGADFLVVCDYQPQKEGEVALLVGDLVCVDVISFGMCSGLNKRTGARGLFPLENLEQRI